MRDAIHKLRKNRSVTSGLTRGYSKMPDVSDHHSTLGAAAYTGIGIGILFFIVWSIYKKDFRLDAFALGWAVGFLGYCLSPALWFLWILLRYQRRPSRAFFGDFPFGQKVLCLLILSYATTYGFMLYAAPPLWQWYAKAVPVVQSVAPVSNHTKGHRKPRKEQSKTKAPVDNNKAFAITWLSIATLLLWFSVKKPRQKRSKQNVEDPSFSLWFGKSTGKLANLHHGSSIAENQHVVLSLEDAAKNILTLGGIGSGKTSCTMHPFLIQLLDQECGGLIFDIKGDFKKAVMQFAEAAGREIVTIGVGHQRMNLLAGLTPEVASSFLKSVFMLSTKGSGDSFWIDTAAELCRNTLGILSFLPQYYSLQGLYGYLFDLELRNSIDGKIEALAASLDDRQAKLLASYRRYHSNIFDFFDDKVKAGVNATVAQALSPFNHPDLVEAFCSMQDDHVPMEAVLDGAVYLVNLPLSVWGLGGKVVYSLIKLRFYNVMQQRSSRQEWDQERPVFFLCDEFQEIVSANKDGLSDLNFWDKSRSSKTIGIISAQAVSSFYAALGDRDVAHALLQNFRQKICFSTEDLSTLEYFNNLADKVEVARVTKSYSSGKQSNPGQFLSSSSTSTSYSTTLADKPILSPQLFRQLQPTQAVAVLSIDGRSMDDVLWLQAIYLT